MHGDADNDLPSEDTVESTFAVETESDSGSLPSCDDIDANPDGHWKLVGAVAISVKQSHGGETWRMFENS